MFLPKIFVRRPQIRNSEKSENNRIGDRKKIGSEVEKKRGAAEHPQPSRFSKSQIITSQSNTKTKSQSESSQNINETKYQHKKMRRGEGRSSRRRRCSSPNHHLAASLPWRCQARELDPEPPLPPGSRRRVVALGSCRAAATPEINRAAMEPLTCRAVGSRRPTGS